MWTVIFLHAKGVINQASSSLSPDTPSNDPTHPTPIHSTSSFLSQHAHTLVTPTTHKAAQAHEFLSGICIFVLCLFTCVCTCKSIRAASVFDDDDCMPSQAGPATVPCHKSKNINMLSLQQGASHQGNNSARHTHIQSAKTHRLKGTSKTSRLKL